MASPDQTSCWKYSYDTTFSNPVYSSQTIRDPGPKQLVALDPGNIQPRGSFELALLNAPPSSQEKIIYTLRHGDTAHNEDSETWGKPIAWRYLSGLRKNFDPQITRAGIDNATLAGRYLGGMMYTKSVPRPVIIYTSPLKRCIETSMYMIKTAGLDKISGDRRWPPVILRVREGLREWMGYGHGHNSDRHGSRAEIQALVEQLKAVLDMEISYQLDVPEQESLQDETYTDVDRRVRGVLNDIFDDASSRSCVMLVLHGRSNKSFLRVLGHPPATVEDFEMANCAVLPYRVTRRLLDDNEVRVWAARESTRERLDQDEAENAKRVRDAQAVLEVRDWDSDPELRARLGSLWDYLRSHAERGDPAADEAMDKLRSDLG